MSLLLAAAEPSKTAFYIVGGALVVWAVVVSFVGITRPDFPRAAAPGRAAMLLSVALGLGAMVTAVLTS